jgi:hypothetical protein
VKLFTAISVVVLYGLAMPGFAVMAQEPELERPEPPKLDTFEVDANGDNVPDGWYNLRDCVWVRGGVTGNGRNSHCFRFENPRPGRPARASRAFGVDGRKIEALIVGAWVRAERIGPGERLGDDPGLVIDFLGDQLKAVRRASLGPWTKSVGPTWTRVVKRIAIPSTTRDAILSLGLLGATGVLEVDDLTIELVPIGSPQSNNLVINGDFELGDPAPYGWAADNGAKRVFPGHDSPSAVELARSNSRLLSGLGVPVSALNSLKISVSVHPRDLRGADAAHMMVFFLNDEGLPLNIPGGGQPILKFAGTSDWKTEEAVVPVPAEATRAVLQFEKTHGSGTLTIDDVIVLGNPQPDPVEWKPYHIETKKSDWMPIAASKSVMTGSALDASASLDAPAGNHGFVSAKGGRLVFKNGKRAKFFGVQLLAPTAFQDADRAESLVDRLAKSGVNLVRIGDLDTPLGPGRSLFDDTRDDTKAFDPISLAKLDHLIALLKKRGIYVAIELQSSRRFRTEDDVPTPALLPLGGGPASIFDPKLQATIIQAATALLKHLNPETGLALKDDPALAWVTIFGEISLYDQIDDPGGLSSSLTAELKSRGVAGRGGWRTVEAASLKEMADTLRAVGVRVPIAGVSHWRREPEFVQAQTSPGLDLVDDRLFWLPRSFLAPDRRTLVLSRDGGLLTGAAKKRRTDHPYVVGQWCNQASGAWSLPFEGGDLMLASLTAATEDWDAIVRRGIFINPQSWGEAAPGTGGGEDLFMLSEVANAIPPVYALLPHASSIYLRHQGEAQNSGTLRTKAAAGIPGWDSKTGRLVIDTPHTQAIAGWCESEPGRFPTLTLETTNNYAVVAVSSVGNDPIARSKRLLVTAVARVEPTGFKWVDEWRRDVADPGVPPLLQEPVHAKVTWRQDRNVKAFILDAQGKRVGPAVLEKTGEGVMLVIDGKTPGLHFELVAD